MILFRPKFLFISICLFAFNLLAEDLNSPILITADKFSYQELDTDKQIFAEGDVEAIQDNKKIFADFIEYSQNKDLVNAKGNVRYIDLGNYTLKSNQINLQNKLKFGQIGQFSLLTSDQVTLNGNSAIKDDQKIIAKGIFFTPCEVCHSKVTIWSFKAKEAIYDRKNNNITYKHAVFYFYNVPSFYTPYLSHRTKTGPRKTGLLGLTYSRSSNLKSYVKLPVYLNISPNQDATITPIITEKKYYILEGEHRLLKKQGLVESQFSFTRKQDKVSSSKKLDNNYRYWFSSISNFQVSQQTQVGWQSKFTSDKSYLRDYDYQYEDFLTNRLYVDQYNQNSSYSAQIIKFQNLRPNSREINQTPLILPFIETSNIVKEFADGSYWKIDMSFLNNQKYYQKADTKRITISNSLNKKIILDNGQIFNSFAAIRTDLYHYDNTYVNARNFTGFTSRYIPEVGINWQYPHIKYSNSRKIIITPVISTVFSPNTNINKKILIEDGGESSEINDSNIFTNSQSSGYDYIDRNLRVGYGIKGSLIDKSFKVGGLFGQMYHNLPEKELAGSKDNRLSDYIGRFNLDLIDKIIINYNFRIDRKDLILKYNSLNIYAKYQEYFIISTALIEHDKKAQQLNKQVYLEMGTNKLNGLTSSVYARRDFTKRDQINTKQSPWINAGVKVKYFIDCIEYNFAFGKDFTQNQNNKRNYRFAFSIKLKNIG